MERTLGIGVLGTGMGLDLAYVNDEPGTRFEVRGFCASREASLARAARKTGVGGNTIHYRELLARPDIDVIAIFTPDHLHAEQAMEALKSGKHVLITKPFTTSAADALEVAKLADETGLKVMVGETCRYYTSFLAAKQFLDDGDLGDVIFADAWYLHELGNVFELTPWRLEVPQDFMYGGVCHPLDSLIWFMGEVEEVHCLGNKGGLYPAYPLEDNFLINVRFANGGIGRVLGAYDLVQPPRPMMGLGINGTKGSVEADFTDFQPSSCRVRLSRLPGGAAAELNFPADTEGAYGQGQAVRRYMVEFEECIINDTQPQLNAWEGIKTIAALDACWESLKTGQPVKVETPQP